MQLYPILEAFSGFSARVIVIGGKVYSCEWKTSSTSPMRKTMVAFVQRRAFHWLTNTLVESINQTRWVAHVLAFLD